MADIHPADDTLQVLARAYREHATGLLTLGSDVRALRLAIEHGQLVGVLPAPDPTGTRPLPSPDESAGLRLERILVDLGIRPRSRLDREPLLFPTSAAALLERLLAALTSPVEQATFEERVGVPDDATPVAGSTEQLILEAVQRLGGGERVRAALGDLDRPLVATKALALEERTLTLTEGYLLSRIDGVVSARQLLRLVHLDESEAQRSLLGLLLTGRVAYRPPRAEEATPAPEPPAPRGETSAPPLEESVAPPVEEQVPAQRREGEATPAEPEPVRAALAEAVGESGPPPEPTGAQAEAASAEPTGPPAPSSTPEMDEEMAAQRREILELFQSLPPKNHFQVLGIAPGCSDAEVKRAYVALAKRFHPDAHQDPRLADLHDILEAIFIRIGEAWEVLGDAASRSAYEARFAARPAGRMAGGSVGRPAPEAPPEPDEPAVDDGASAADEALREAQALLSQARYWDVIQMLEAAIPRLQPRRQQHQGRILLAKAYAKNPNWVRRAEETLQDVVREDPANADAHYELGLLYKAGGFRKRALSMFRKTVELRPTHRQAAAELYEPGADEAPSRGLLGRLFRKT